MKEYRFYLEDISSYSNKFQEVAKSIEERVNSDSEMLEKARKTNEEFAAKLKNVVNDIDNIPYMGAIVSDILWKTPRFQYIKNIECNGTMYEAEIDLLSRRISFY